MDKARVTEVPLGGEGLRRLVEEGGVLRTGCLYAERRCQPRSHGPFVTVFVCPGICVRSEGCRSCTAIDCVARLRT